MGKTATTVAPLEAENFEPPSGCTNLAWASWKWQVSNRIKHPQQLARYIALTDNETKAISQLSLPLSITPYYLNLLTQTPNHPLRKTVVPVCEELDLHPGEADDPLGEDGHSPCPGLVHRYPDRVLFLVTSTCATYCRYCTRSRLVGKTTFGPTTWDAAIAYIEKTPQVRDVLLSGGDPLTLSDSVLESLLKRLKAIKHVEILRIGTKVPITLPQRITSKLCNILQQYHPLWMSIHCTHPDEITPEVTTACARLAKAGIPLGSQTVLLKGVNDNLDTMRRLVHALVKVRIRPYYLYQCDPIRGSAHWRTPIKTGIDIIEGLRGHTTGYCVPHYVIDAPGGGGKIPLSPMYVTGQEGKDLLLRNYEGQQYRYPDYL